MNQEKQGEETICHCYIWKKLSKRISKKQSQSNPQEDSDPKWKLLCNKIDKLYVKKLLEEAEREEKEYHTKQKKSKL